MYSEKEKHRIRRAIIDAHGGNLYAISIRPDSILIIIPDEEPEILVDVAGLPVVYEHSPEPPRLVASVGGGGYVPTDEDSLCLTCQNSIVQPGMSVSHGMHQFWAGTFGCVAYDRDDFMRWGLLGAGHVIAPYFRIVDAEYNVAPFNPARGDPVAHPAVNDSLSHGVEPATIARLKKWSVPVFRDPGVNPAPDWSGIPGRSNFTDAAFADIPSEPPTSPLIERISRSIAGIGIYPAPAKKPEVGMPVIKVGRTTGYRTGTIVSTNVDTITYFSPDGQPRSTVDFVDQFEVRGTAGAGTAAPFFATGGDSGSIVLEAETGAAVGMVLSVAADNSKTFCSPAHFIEDGLNVRFSRTEEETVASALSSTFLNPSLLIPAASVGLLGGAVAGLLYNRK